MAEGIEPNKMTYNMAITLIILTVCCRISGYAYDTGVHFQEYTRPIILKQGTLQGVVMTFTKNRKPFVVEQYRGIPYAAPPVGELRFMPSGSAPSWFGTKFADTFGPVCPQRFPDTRTMTVERRERFVKLKEMLLNESEDCLYLNIYAPYQENSRGTRRYPVMVYIHGESFEWNSGNPYDGSVLAAYGNVIVVTLNYRLGVLGFLKAGTEEHSKSNFGLVDQIAALLWVKENIGAFGGDPNTVTLFGHGTGAVCASLLMLSPMVVHEGNKMLFQRAILMSGTALSDWALASNPQGVSYQVAQALNCQIQDDFAACLRRKRLEDIMAAAATPPAYRTRFGPVIDSIVIPNDPKKSMTTYNNIFKRFELLYGVTELESIHLLSPEALKLGMLEKDRDQELRKYLRFRCEMKSELCVTRTLAEYLDTDFTLNDEKYDDYTGHEPDRASLARDALLDILSDARTVAPIVQMAKYHAALNLQSYFYVFTHKTSSKEYLNNKSYNGEELPYVFGVPLGGFNQHFADHYNDNECLLSEKIMTYFSNFAYTGDPNMPRRNDYRTLGPEHWEKFDVDWPEYDLTQERYLQLGTPPYVLSRYRAKEMKYWNEIFPELSFNQSYSDLSPIMPHKTVPSFPPRSQPPWIISHDINRVTVKNKYENFNKPLNTDRIYGVVKSRGTSAPDNMIHQKEYGTIVYGPQQEPAKDLSTTITIALGSVILFLNLCVLLIFYIRRYRKRKLRNVVEKADEQNNENPGNSSGCNIVKMVRKSSRSDDVYEAVKAGSSQEKLKLPRQMSSSTIDAHTKVRDWITNEIIYKYSPRILRRPREPDRIKTIKQETIESSPLNDSSSTLGRSPTRPVSPCDNFKSPRPPLIKSSSIPVQKTKKPEKVSVAIDATPSGRGNSVLQQQPIELTKSLDRTNFEPALRRSLTLDDFSNIITDNKQELRKSTTNINLKMPSFEEPTVIRIEHSHSKSEPVQDLYGGGVRTKKLKTFDPNCDVNVTSRDETIQTNPLTPEESLMIIKRRKCPKVLPDYPSKEMLAKKRRSVPVANHLFTPIPENTQQTSQPNSPLSKTFAKFPPEPPRRTTSTLSRKPTNNSHPVCQSAPMLAVEPPASPEPEVTCNNLYVGPLIPKLTKNELSNSENSKLNTNPVYDSLRNVREQKKELTKPVATTIISADPNQPIKRIEPKVIIKPVPTKSGNDPKKNIPRVVVNDNLPTFSEESGEKTRKISHIPTLVKNTKESSSESSPSEESDTGTVVKRL